MDDLKAIRKRAEVIGLPFYTWAKLSSEPGSKLHQPQISNWLNGTPPSAVKVARLLKVLEQVEALCAADTLKLDLTDADNVRIAIARLEEKHAPNTATAPWKFRGAVAAPDDNVGAVSSATEILAGSAK